MIVANLVHISLNPWNLEIPRSLKFPVANNLELKIVRSVNPPYFQTKSLVWTMQELFNQYNIRGLYASASFVTRLDGAPLGFGSLRSTLHSGRDEQRNVSSLATLDSAPTEKIPYTDHIGSWVIPSSIKPRQSVVSHSPAAQLGRRGLDIRLQYIPNGALFSDLALVDSIIYFIALAANRDPKTATTKLARSYNIEKGFFIEVSSIDEDNELEVGRVIEVLGRLPAIMYEKQVGGRWAELRGVIKFDGVNVGRIIVEKGVPENDANSNSINVQRSVNDTATGICQHRESSFIL